jgi:hypothetical protein
MSGLKESILGMLLKTFLGGEFPMLEGSPKPDKWYTVSVPEARSSDGGRWHGYLRKGRSNNLVVYFFGGGVSPDDYSAARPHSSSGGFYNPGLNTDLNIMANAMTRWGIGSQAKTNPFRDWSFIVVPYCNGDFHAGAGQRTYVTAEGEESRIFYEGHRNYRLLMAAAMRHIDSSPGALLIAGASAGGFGSALLADDVAQHFPSVQNVTVCVDSSVLIFDNWHEVLTQQWTSPKTISDQVHGNNITLDALTALHDKYGNRMKLLFDCSVRDYALAQTQVYFDEGHMPERATREHADRFQQLLQGTVSGIQHKVPHAGIFIWDDVTEKSAHLSRHTAIGLNFMFKRQEDGTSISEWIIDAVNGSVSSHGIELLDRTY